MANAKKNDSPAKAVDRKSYRKKPTLKEKQAAAAKPEAAMIEHSHEGEEPAATFTLSVPRLSGREYARQRHLEVLRRPGIVSVLACQLPQRVKGRSKRGWTEKKV